MDPELRHLPTPPAVKFGERSDETSERMAPAVRLASDRGRTETYSLRHLIACLESVLACADARRSSRSTHEANEWVE